MEETTEQGQTITPSLQSFRNAIRNLDISGIFIFFLLASPKKKNTSKQTNKQKERWEGHRNSCGQLHWVKILIKKSKQEILENTAIQEKLQLRTYNKLLDETKEEHCYILNR